MKNEKITDAEVVKPGTEMKASEPNAPALATHDSLIELAITKGADPGTLERLFALKERHEANEAKKAYVVAMAQFKTVCPYIKKTASVSYKQVNYNFAPLPEILEQIKGAMNTCGLSHSWTTSQESKAISVTCVVTHVLGHSEQTTLQAEPDTSGSKNSIQAVGSSVSYLQRYTLKSLLGLAEGDDDGQAASETVVEYLDEKQILELDGVIADNGIDKAAFLKWYKIASLSDIPADSFGTAKAALLKAAK